MCYEGDKRQMATIIMFRDSAPPRRINMMTFSNYQTESDGSVEFSINLGLLASIVMNGHKKN